MKKKEKEKRVRGSFVTGHCSQRRVRRRVDKRARGTNKLYFDSDTQRERRMRV